MSVTAVVVARDGRVWLPATLAAVAAQTRSCGRIIAVDAGSADDSGQILRAALGDDRVITMPTGRPAIGFGQAVAAALMRLEPCSDGGAGRPDSGRGMGMAAAR